MINVGGICGTNPHIIAIACCLIVITYNYIYTNFPFFCPGKKCHKSCHKRPDGDYASCHGCRFFMTCAGGKKFDKRPCPPGSFFDNDLKRCEIQSSTCDPAGKRKQY